MTDDAASRDRVLVLAPAGRDAQLAAAVLSDAGLAPLVCADMEAFCQALERGAAVGVITQEALAREARARLVEALTKQPLWADFPLVVLASRPATHAARLRLSETVGEVGNVTLMDRPLHPETLVSTVKSAMRARARQYQTRELMSQLEEAVQQRDKFLATLSHELRNPLGAIRNAMRVLERHDDSERRRPMAIIERQVAHMARLIEDLLDVSRVTTGKVVLQRRRFDLRDALQQTLTQMEPAFEQHHVGLIASLGAHPLWVDADVVRIEQVFTNLLNNAVKYTPAGGRVDVSAGVDGPQVWVRVRDTGVGIEPEMLTAIFDLFSQVDRSLDRAQGGMGIGLTLVRSLLALHGGTVTVASEGLGKGSEFTARLPLAAPGEAPAVASGDATSAIEEKPHVLLVEDNEDNREMLRDLLAGEGFRVDVAADGAEAVAEAQRLEPEVVIVDIGLPVLDGFEVARRVRRSLGDSVTLVALSGYGRVEDRRRSMEAGFDAHLTKPVDFAELQAALASRARSAASAMR